MISKTTNKIGVHILTCTCFLITASTEHRGYIYESKPPIIDESGGYRWVAERGGFFSIEDVERDPSGKLIAVGSHIIELVDGVWRAANLEIGVVNLKDVEIISNDEWWAVGYEGVVIHKTGDNIQKYIIDERVDLNAIEFIANKGWIIGNVRQGRAGVIFKFINREWKKENIPVVGGLLALLMISDSDGWAGGYGGTILRFNGVDWLRITDITLYNIYGLSVDGNNNIWLVGGGSRFVGTGKYVIIGFDGSNWKTHLEESGYPLEKIKMFDDHGWAIGGNYILKYSNNKWSLFDVVGSGYIDYVSTILCDNMNNIDMIISIRGSVYKKNIDGFETIRSYIDSASGSAIISDQEIWVNSEINKKIIHFDGNRWTNINIPGILDIKATSATNVWAVGGSGTIVHYDGNRWDYVNSPTNYNIVRITLIDDNNGFAIARSNKEIKSQILSLHDGVWESMLVVDEYLSAIDAISVDEIFVVGNRKIFHFNDHEWSNSSVPYNLSSVEIFSDLVGWAGGENILLYYDGISWSVALEIDESVSVRINRIIATESSEVWALGNHDVIMKLYNGAWRFVRKPSGSGGIEFFDGAYIDNDGSLIFVAIGQPDSVLIWRDSTTPGAHTPTPVNTPIESSTPTIFEETDKKCYLPMTLSISQNQ